jgi:DNA-binding LacI/PurR family transcriptional regulator
MPTMHDVAKRAGVAISTVSYAINGTRPISEETRQRIFAAMDELGYRPNLLARGLASKRTRIIALLLPTSSRGLGLTEIEFVVSAAEAARENGYYLIFSTAEINNLDELRQLTRQGLVDGLVLMEIHQNDERINLLREIDFPFTMIGRMADNEGINHIDIDFGQTIRLVLDHLTQLGHTRIAFINHALEEYEAGYGPTVRSQIRFLEEIEARDLYGVSRFCEANPECGYRTTLELLAEAPDVTAIVVMNDRAIPGIMRAISDRGLSVPEDISLVAAVTAARLSESTMPTITTAEAPAYELGRIGTEMLIQQLEGTKEEFSEVLVPCELVIRESTAPYSRAKVEAAP